MVFAIALFLTIFILPQVDHLKGAKPLGQEMGRVIQPHQKIAVYEVGNRPSLVLHSPKPVQFLESKAELTKFLMRREGYLFTTVSEYEKIKKSLPRGTKILDKKGDLLVIYRP